MPRKANETPLTRDAILQAASQLIAQEGVEAFSMRKLAALLAVNPMAIYYYLPNKETILQAVIEEALAGLSLPDADNWQTAVRHVATAYYDFARAHPELFAHVITYNRSIPVAFAVDEYLVTALTKAGIPPKLVVQIVYMVLNTVAGLTLSEIKGTLGRSRDVDEAHQAFRQLPQDEFPAIRALADQLTPADLRPDFDFALAVLIAGISASTAHI